MGDHWTCAGSARDATEWLTLVCAPSTSKDHQVQPVLLAGVPGAVKPSGAAILSTTDSLF